MSPPPPPTVEVLVVHPEESAPVTVTLAATPEEVKISSLEGFVKLNMLMSFVALGSLLGSLLCILLKVATWTSFLLPCSSVFFFFSSAFIFHSLKEDLRLRKTQINSGSFRICMIFGYLSSLCGICLFFIGF